jgi:hypothetical protein
MIHLLLGLAILAFHLLRIRYLYFECRDSIFCLRSFWPRIHITAKHLLLSTNLDSLTDTAIRLTWRRAHLVLQYHRPGIQFLFIRAVVELDVWKLFMLGCARVYFLRGPRWNEFDVHVRSHRRAALRLMVLVVFLELMMLNELLIEAVSLAWWVSTILWAYVSNVLRTGAIGDPEAVMNEIIGRLYRS